MAFLIKIFYSFLKKMYKYDSHRINNYFFPVYDTYGLKYSGSLSVFV